MPYSTKDDVALLLKGMTFSSITKITDAEVTDMITARDAWIDGKLSEIYQTPITGTESLKILKIISKYFVAAEVVDIVITATGKDNPVAKRWTDFANQMLDEIISGDLDLSDAARAGISDLTRTGKFDESGEEREPKFFLDKEY